VQKETFTGSFEINAFQHVGNLSVDGYPDNKPRCLNAMVNPVPCTR